MRLRTKRKTSSSQTVNILFTCVGRRVALVRSFQQAAAGLSLRCRTFGTDINAFSPGLYACDRGILTRPITNDGYLPEILALVRKHHIDLIVPTIDPELIPLSKERSAFEALGATLLVSSRDVLETCQDKRRAYRFLVEHGFDTPRTMELADVRRGKLTFPVFLKPWDGSASRGNAVAANREELAYWGRKIPHCIVQEYVDGQEFTCDVYVDFHKRVRTVVPRRRIEVRGGEVSKSQTVRHPGLIDACRNLVEQLGAGPGVITIQCFITKDDRIKFIEINPRFGGGSPLSIRAGADFPKWILAAWAGRTVTIRPDGWRAGLCMLRFDEGVWVDESRLLRGTDKESGSSRPPATAGG